jgi:membrane fusion protein, multidrug efflux system
MFVRSSFAQSILQNAFLVPQAAISRDPRGNATLYVVGANNKAEQRTVSTDRTQNAYWVVTSGLKKGDRVITQGLANLRPNADIVPVPANTPQRVRAPSPEQMKKMQAEKGKAD